MKHILLLSLPLAFLVACGPAVKKGCKETGCSAGSVCNTNTGTCEILGVGGGGGTTGGGGGTTGGGSGGGGATGGGGGTDAGVDAGMVVVDPFDDGGVFVAGDICNYAIPVRFDGGVPLDGGSASVVTVTVDLAAASNQYVADCNISTGDGNDVMFAITLTEPKGLIVTTTDTSGKNQDAVLALLSSPCPLLRHVACTDISPTDEVLTVQRIPAGTWYVLLENNADANVNDGTYDVTFELVDATPSPPNDSCSAPQALTFTNGTTSVTGTTAGGFNDTGGAPLSCSPGSALGVDVFYSFTLTQPQNVSVTVDTPLGSNFTPAFAITNSCGVGGAANQRGCQRGAGGTFLARNLPAGTYYLVVDGDDAATGTFTLDVALSPPTPSPSNDTCATPTQLIPNASQMIDANSGAGDYAVCVNATGGDVIYEFTTTMAHRVTLTATGSGGADGVLSLRRAPCDDVTNEVACIDDAVAGPEVLTEFNLPAGTYYVVLAAYSPSAGQFGLELALDPPVLPPTNEDCTMPEVVTLTAGMATRAVNLAVAAADIASDLCAPNADGADVVYEVAIPAMQTLTVVATPVGSVVDPVLFARQPVCAMLASAVCVDAAGPGLAETLVVPNTTVGPLTVFIVVKAYDLFAPGALNLTFSAM